MKFYNEKLRQIRKEKKIKITEFATKVEVTRNTLWLWESGRFQPPEKMVRRLAKALDIPVNHISDLTPELPISRINTNQIDSLLYSFACTSMSEQKKIQSIHLEALEKQLDEFNQAVMIINTFLNTIELMCYAKNISSQYITANQAFLKGLSYDKDYRVSGKKDKDFFPAIEAKRNTDEDERVMITGLSTSREGYIPGSRKKKWGVISKIPIYDSQKEIAGVLGYFTDITERKKAEQLIETLVKGLNGMDDEIIWMCKTAKPRPGGGIIFDDHLYVVDNLLKKKILEEANASKLSWKEAFEHITKYYHGKREKMDIEQLEKTGKTEVRGVIKLPVSQKNLMLRSKVYYDSKKKLFIGIAREDTERQCVERIAERLRFHGIKEDIIQESIAGL